MRGKAEGDGAARLLALVQRRGQASRALETFTPQAVTVVRNVSAKTAAATALALLRAAVERRRTEFVQALAAKRNAKRQRVSDSSKSDVVLAAKLAQSVVKAYASASTAAMKEDELLDLVAALDLACVALYVVCALEHTVRLGDLVVDNLLYQVAKKYAEIPAMRESASCVAACVHIRVWSAHYQLCGESSGNNASQSKLIQMLGMQVEVSNSLASTVVKSMELVAESPRPQNCHSVQFARLLLGHTNTCITLLNAVQNHQAVLLVSETSLAPWIQYLQDFGGENSKVASALSDRAFRILWKCAATIDNAKGKQTQKLGAALPLRSTALSFLLKCSKYTPSYFIQQVHRVGAQHERATKRSKPGLQELHTFYTRSANTLIQHLPDSSRIYSSKTLEWEYIHWLEHFSLICEARGMHLKSAIILENVVEYVQSLEKPGGPIEYCLLFSIAGTLFGAAGSAKNETDFSSQDCSTTSAFDEKLVFGAGRLFGDLFHCTPERWNNQCEKAARVYLKKLEALVPCGLLSLISRDHAKFVGFLTRSLKKSSAKAFNYSISVQHSSKYQLYSQVVTSFREMCKAAKELRSTSLIVDSSVFEALILEESRLHRMAVVLSARSCWVDSLATTKPALHAISHHAVLVRELLGEVMMDEKPRKAILQGILGDINAIARECYSCATYCYKKGNHQDTISALTGAFELAESYLEYVMCSNLTAEDILKAHVQLKVDAIASLIAHCYRELGDVTKSRIFIGHSILYCGNIHESLPHGNVDKYVSCVLQELKLQNDGAKLAVAANFKDFTDNATHVFKSRHVSDEQIIRLWIAIRTSLERISGENVVNARTRANRNDADTTISIHSVQLCGALENHLNGVLMKLKYELHDCKNIVDALLEVSESLATRKEVFCTYYCTRKLDRAIKGLVLTYRSLSQAAERLLLFSDKAAVDLGGIYGWRGVIAIEVTMLISYGSTAEEVSDVSDICISEESAIADFERCLMYWREYGDGSGILFDELYKINCLESVCNAVSLISCSAMEQYARTLLKAFQVSANCHNQTVCSTPSATFLVSLLHNDNSCTQLEDGICSDSLVGTEIRSFELVDKELSLAGSSPCSAQAYQHLLNATMMLSKVKNNAKKHSSSTTMKGIGMRELFVHTILSNIYFREGRSKCAISQAKLALRICWKMAKKFAATSSSTEASYFELPQEISLSQWQQQKTTYLASFVAFECSSWDVLFVAKLLLSRIASLYSYFDEPNRTALYLVEALRLVGGLNLRFFRRTPIYEYAELELNASHLEKAKTAMSLLTPIPMQAQENSATVTENHLCIQSDITIIEQKCNEIMQQGDVHISEGEQQAGLSCFSEALKMLSDVKLQHASQRLSRMKARCWRKYTQQQSLLCDFSDSASVEILLASMKKLKRSMKCCDAGLEKVKCMLELGRINVRLLRSSSPRAFFSLEQTLALLEEAYLHGDCLGIPHLSQALRTSLGMAYFAEIEEYSRNNSDTIDKNSRSRFLCWASGALLANAESVGVVDLNTPPSDTDTDITAQEALTMQLQQLSACPIESQQHTRDKIEEMAQTTAKNVRQLPDTWTIISLTIGLSSELVITRFSTNDIAPISFCLPNVDWNKCIREIDAIVEESRKNLSGHTAEEAGSWSTQQKKEWWATRNILNERIGKAILCMQTNLGFWRCLLVKGTSSRESEHVRRPWSMLVSTKRGPVKLAERNRSLLCAIADAQKWLLDDEVIDGLRHIAAEIEVPLSSSTARQVLEVLRNQAQHPEQNSSEMMHTSPTSHLQKLSTDKILNMKVSDIKQLLAAEGLRTDGLKKVLIERLITARETALLDASASSTCNGKFSTIMILNYQLQQFPWEGMDIMKGSAGVTRMPSLDLIIQNADRAVPSTSTFQVQRNSVRFLLNPGGDLKSTQNQLGPILESGARTYGWEGTVGEVPEPDTLSNYLSAADLYIYCGHGSGEAYLHRDKVLSLESKCSAALLFGCSSGRLEREGIFGPSGAVLAYLRAGSPAVLAMLWDVTDRDTDQLSVKVLQEWLLTDSEERPALAKVLQEARGVCKLNYLNGHAAVCYGLPLCVTKS